MGQDPTQDELFVQAGTSPTTPARINISWQEFTPRDASHCLAHREKSILNSFAPSAGSQTGIAGTPTRWDPSSTPCCCRQGVTPTFPLLPAALLLSLLGPCSPFCLAPSSSLSVTNSSLPFVVCGADGFFSGKSAAAKDSAQNQVPLPPLTLL